MKEFRIAFPKTIPIMAAYIFLGISYGILMTTRGFPFWLPVLTALLVYTGSLEFLLTDILLSSYDPLSALITALMIGSRHIFYGMAMLPKYRGTGKAKFYLIYTCSDETFAVNYSTRIPAGLDKTRFYTSVSALDQAYWVCGSAIGGLCGSLITFDWLSPYIIERIKKAIATLEQLQEEQGSDADEYTMNGYSISASALQRGLFYYDMALRMYEGSDTTTEWTDLLGLLAPTEAVQQILEDILSGDISTIEMLEDHMHDIYDSYAQWKGYNDNDAEREQAIAEWKEAIRRDAEREYEMGDVSEELLADFLEGLKN